MQRIFLILLFLTSLQAENIWDNAVPPAEKFDWLQTTSGEWLKGTIKGMYDRKLEFDSDKFDLQVIKWDDVKQLISYSNTSLNIEGRGRVTGKLYIHDDIIVLSNEDESIELKRNSIISLTNGTEGELSNWQGKMVFALDISSGNTDKLEYSSNVSIKRQTSSTRLKLDFLATYSEVSDIRTEENRRFSTSIDIFLTRRFFWRPVFGDYYKDSFQNIKGKYSVGAGAGYDIYASNDLDWTIFVGLAYQSTDFIDVPIDELKIVTTPALVFSSNYNYDITDDIELILKYQAYIVNEDSGSYVQNAVTSLETELVNDFKLDFTITWDRIQNPTVGTKDGVPYTPDKNDFKSTVGLAYSF